MEPFLLKDAEYFTIQSWCKDHPQLAAGFTTKNGGTSIGHHKGLNMAYHVNDSKEKVTANRQIVANKLDFPLTNWVGSEQTHKNSIWEVSTIDAGKGACDYESALPDTDGLFTREEGILLTLCYADCVPLYFIHSKTKAIGIAHAGWQGTVQGIAVEMVKVFKSHGIYPGEIEVAIGPSITDKQYIVDSRVIDKVDEALDESDERPYKLVSPNQYSLSLQQLNKQLLIKAGIQESKIQVTSLCTSEQESYFFSHRRDKGKTGRMMSFIGWREDV
ncbi:peptidoglycan editing factor PgeF [Niallia taxi]|uniref:peptidoglycan editing factor PgeF n=1 Tax=Niallia taxi TaxID=2499688 RepID=UPI00300BA909